MNEECLRGTQYRVLADYEVNDPHPLVLAAGVAVRVLCKDSGWPGWVWVQSGNDAGWIPESYLENPASAETLTSRAYNGSDLSARRGELITALEAAHGWIHATGDAGRTGWFPLFNLRPVPPT